MLNSYCREFVILILVQRHYNLQYIFTHNRALQFTIKKGLIESETW